MLRFTILFGLIAILTFPFTLSTEAQTVNKKTNQSRSRAVLPRLEVANSEAGMVFGSFTARGYTIYFEAVRGEANMTNDPDAPTYGLDIRVMDWNRTPFLMQSAGSTPLSISWADDGTNDEAFLINPSDRLRAFAMLPAAAESLKTYAEKKKEEVSDLAQSDLKQVIDLLESVKSEDFQDADTIPDSQSIGTTYNHKTFIMRKDAFINGAPADHSAVLLKIYSSSGTLVRQFSSCNHGTCATSSSMYSKCFKSFLKSNSNVYTMDKACDQWSPYITNSNVNGHVCNNDTRQQYLSIKGSANWNWGICSFSMPAILAYYKRAPNCD